MLYKFKSKATGDVIMLGPNGDQLLRILGREPAATGIVEVAAMPAAMAALREAVTVDERERAPGATEGSAPPGTPNASGISLRQRVWPVLEMLQRAHAAGEPVVWGV